MDSKKHEIDREQLVAEADKIPDDTQAIETMVQAGDQMQEETQAAVDRMRNMALEAEDIGNATAIQLDQQMDQMGRVGEDIDEVHQNVKSAARTVKKMMGGACRDQCVIILLCLNVAAIAGVVAMYATAPAGRRVFARQVAPRLQPLGLAIHDVAGDVYKLFI
ncbi:MAG: uncharacterized protein KVP18_005056 [Porospora cf. gigantea A]|nr:MAG: hypothetical protein KVP18_005056 [Porospora cf. gigantea A]